jgi:hypothetical protein
MFKTEMLLESYDITTDNFLATNLELYTDKY